MPKAKTAAAPSAPSVTITYYVEIYSSWCHWAEPAWGELKTRFAGRVGFDWRVALMRAEDFPATSEQCDWFYRRSGTVTGSAYRLNSGWVQPNREAYVTPNLVAEATRDFLPAGDDRARLALARAAMLDGEGVHDLNTAARIAAAATGGKASAAKLKSAAKSPTVRARVEASTAEFFAHRLSQRPAFVLTSEIGDKAVFSGVWRAEPLVAALEGMLADAAAYAGYRAHHGAPPQA